jgi:hypothetical protein
VIAEYRKSVYDVFRGDAEIPRHGQRHDPVRVIRGADTDSAGRPNGTTLAEYRVSYARSPLWKADNHLTHSTGAAIWLPLAMYG